MNKCLLAVQHIELAKLKLVIDLYQKRNGEE